MAKKFKGSFVLNHTHTKILATIDYSILKTVERLQDVQNQGKRKEIFETLQSLNKWKQFELDFRTHNLKLFEGEPNVRYQNSKTNSQD